MLGFRLDIAVKHFVGRQRPLSNAISAAVLLVRGVAIEGVGSILRLFIGAPGQGLSASLRGDLRSLKIVGNARHALKVAGVEFRISGGE